MSKTLLTLDFETYYDTKLSLSKITTMEYVRDPQFKVWGVGLQVDDDKPYWVTEDEVASALAEFDWDNTALLCHNTPFDGFVLTQYYGIKPAYYYDTAAMARGWWPGMSASLRATSERCFPTDESMRKGDELVNAKGIYDLPPDIEEQIAGYCIQDVALTYAIFKQLHEAYPHSELDLIDLTTRMFCEPILQIDRERLTRYHESELMAGEQAIKNSGLTRKVLASNQKFATAIEKLGITVPTKVSPNTGLSIPAFGKNDAGWKQLCNMYPEYQHIWDGRIAVKSRINETRASRFLAAAHPTTNELPAPLRYYAAHTGRFGGTDKLNLQNLPRGSELRKCLIAPKDQLIYVADLSNIEARMLAWLAGQDDLLVQFASGEDIYSNFASTVYNKSINKNDHPTERFVGKTAILGLGYGMGAKKFQATLASGAAGPSLDFSDAQAAAVVGKYRQTYNRIPILWKRLENYLTLSLYERTALPYSVLMFNEGEIKLPNKMSLKYKDLRVRNGQLEYIGRNGMEKTYGGRLTENIVQALSRIVITDAMLRLQTEIPNGNVALTVHDEVVIIAPSENPDATMQTVIDTLCRPPPWATELPLDAEGGYAHNYSK